MARVQELRLRYEWGPKTLVTRDDGWSTPDPLDLETAVVVKIEATESMDYDLIITVEDAKAWLRGML